MKKLLVFFLSGFLVFLSAIAISSADEWNLYMPCNDVSSYVQDGDYIWWTGRYGIVQYNRLDGTHQLYTSKDYGEGQFWTASAVAPNGAKWFVEGSGLILRFDSSGWKAFKELANINSIAFDPGGTAWFGTLHGAASYDGFTWRRYGATDGFTDNKVLTGVSDKKGNIWFGTEKDGLFRFDGDTWTKVTVSADSLPTVAIKNLVCDENGVIWTNIRDIIYSFDGTAWNVVPIPKIEYPESIHCFVPDRKGGIWIGTRVDLVYIHGGERTVYTAANSSLAGAPNEEVHALLIDTDGVLWVSQWFSTETLFHLGLSRFDGNNWSRVKIPMPVGNKTYSVVVDSDNVKWFTTSSLQTGHPLASFDGVAWKYYNEADGLAGTWVNSITLDDEGRKWFCAGKGVSCFDGKSWTNYTAENGLPGNQARKGAVDHDGIGWFELDTGLHSFDGHTWTSWNDSVLARDVDGYGLVNISCIAVDRNNIKWFGTNSDGVLSFDGVAWRHYTKDDGLSGNVINCITVDHDNVIWVGTGVMEPEAGACCFDGNTWTSFEYAKQTIFFGITGIAVDEANVKWFVSHSLYSFDGTTWKAYSEPTWGDTYNCIAIDKDGTKWLGGVRMGVLSFRETDGASTGVITADALPKGFAILGNSPNPFNPSTTISFSLPAAGKANLTIYDITGRKVRTLISGQMSAGNHSANWDGRDESGIPVSSGVYFVHLRAESASTAARMLLLK
jgi:ligand-binding sensor domain-containing protein